MRSLLVLLALLAALPLHAAELKLATWNIAWLTLRGEDDPALPRDVPARDRGDWRLLANYAARLEADIVAFQEVDGPEAAERLFPPAQYALFFPAERDVQRAGFAIRRHLRVTQNPDLDELDLSPTAHRSLRRGTDVTVEHRGARLRLLSIHLKSGCRDGTLLAPRTSECEALSRQSAVLAEWVGARAREGIPFAIMGDFNRRFDRPNDHLMAALTAETPLIRATEGVSNPCWSDSGGGRPFVDHILLNEQAARFVIPGSLRVMVYAERDPRMRARLSDHCPVSLRLRLP